MTKKILKYRTVSILSAVSVCLVAAGTVWAYATLAAIKGPVFIVHFDDIAGITQVGSLATFAIIGFLGIVSVIMNSLIALALEERDPFLGKVTAITTFLFAVLLFMAFAAILNVN